MERMTRQSPIISVRVTHEELEMLEGIIEQTKARMEAQGFPPNVTAAGLFRTWLREKAKAAGIKTGPARPAGPETEPLFPDIEILPAPKTTPVVVKPQAVAANVPAARLVDAKPTPTEGLAFDVRNRIALALAGGAFPSHAALAKLAGVDKSSLSRFMQGKPGLGPDKIAALDRTLREKNT